MLGAITRGLSAIANAAKNIGRSISPSTKTKLRQKERPERRRYKVSAIRDSKTCKVCKRMDGTLIVVNSDDSVEAIAKRNKKTPPFHVQCRCTLEKVGIFRGVI
jgi:SPP1 gp7 family putative phage head morphogenesis protein